MDDEEEKFLAGNSDAISHCDYENQFHDLLIKFICEMNLPIETVENPLLKEMIHHLNPNVNLPTIDSIVLTEADEEPAEQGGEESKQEEDGMDLSDSHESTEKRIPFDLTKLPSPEQISVVYTGTDRSFCMICLEWKDHSQVRKLGSSETPIILSVCVAEGVHTMETAQELRSCHIHKSCISHFIPVMNALMKHLRVKGNEKLTRVPDTANEIVFPIVQLIKNAPNDYENELQRKKAMGMFRMHLQRFIIKFACYDQTDSRIVFVPKDPNSKPMKKITTASTGTPPESIILSQPDFPNDFLDPYNIQN